MIFGYIDPGTGYTVTTFGGMIAALLSGFFGIFILFFKKIWRFFRRNKKFGFAVLVAVIAALAVWGGWLMHKSQSTFQGRVIVIGMDALSPEIMEPLMAQGKLPHFAQLKTSGGYRRLKTTNPPQSPVAWTGFSTGKNPGKNGIFDFISRDPKTYRVSLAMSNTESGQAKTVIRAPRFWQYTSRKNIPSVILSCPITFPPDKITGKMLSGMGVPDILGTEGTFSFYTSANEPLRETTGGRVVKVKKGKLIVADLYGPKVARIGKPAEQATVPFKVTIENGQASIEVQNQTVRLSPGQWSGWHAVSFDAGMFRKIKGILKFYLISLEPELQLYVSPINLDPRESFFPISYPSHYSRQLVDEIGLFHTQGMPFDTWALNEGRLDEASFMTITNDIMKEGEALLDLELNRFEHGVFYFYFESSDIIQHMFWRYIDPKHPLYDAAAPAEYKQMIENWYIRLDVILGRVLQQVGPEDTLLVLSDHGFGTYRRAAHINSWLRDNGYLELKDAGATEGQPLLKDIDWSRTRAYAIGFNSIYINQRGREGQGIVAPGEETEKIKNEIAAKLPTWIDAKYREPVVHKVYRQEEVYWGPYQAQTPDLLVGYNIGYDASWQTALGAVPKDIIEDNLKKWSGSHLFDSELVPGVLFSNKPIRTEIPSILDLAPTVLKLTGFSDEEIKSCEFDGKPLF